jgi:hypothetical protein
LTAAREGLRVILVQDRPVLGGNASSEVRLWVLGATSHMGNNNRWAREGGVIDELLVENMWRNPEGNPVVFDSLMLESVRLEPRITLLLNTAAHELEMNGDRIGHVRAFCSQNQITYKLTAPLFVDASGDGILGFLAGADFRIGAEAASEYGEPLGPPTETQDLLGHSLYFYSRDTGRPVKYVAPAFAIQDVEKELPRFRELRASDSGCRLWWLEYGGNLDTVRQTEEIKWELWRIAYGVWNHIKNSGRFPDAENLTLEWMGTIPGKRESRRFVGDYTITQHDVVSQTSHSDAVSYGGWAIDLHPSDGVYSAQPGCTQWHSKGVFQIPYRAMYSCNVPNLFLTGRLISASHIAFGSTRVMATCAHNGQAVGMAAALCERDHLMPRELLCPERMVELQQRLLRTGHHIPGVRAFDPLDLARSAKLSATSTMRVSEMASSGEVVAENTPYALLIPLPAGRVPAITVCVDATHDTILKAELWGSSREGNTTPDILFASVEAGVSAGTSQAVLLRFHQSLEKAAHMFVVVPPFAGGVLHQSTAILPGILTLSKKANPAVAKSAVQTPPEGSGVDSFAFWIPERRPTARNLAVRFEPALNPYEPSNVINGFSRPWKGTNAWVPDAADMRPALQLRWTGPQSVSRVELFFDTDFDHPMESVLMTHPERIMPAVVTSCRVLDGEGRQLGELFDNHQTRRVLVFPSVVTQEITVELTGWGPAPPALFEVRVYA